MRNKETANSSGKSGQQKGKQKKADPLEALKMEIAGELGLDEKVQKNGWDSLSAREAGKIGGHMAKRLKERKQANQ